MNQLSIALLALLSFGTFAISDAKENLVNNAPRCDRHQNPKEELRCREARSAGGRVACRDRTKCLLTKTPASELNYRTVFHPPTGKPIQVAYCKDEDAARRIGMTCNSFPWYNGGYPMRAGGISWDDEWEHYECTIATDNGVCMEWTAHEDSPSEYELGTYTCESVGTTENGSNYCSKWSSVQKETKKCSNSDDGCYPNCKFPTYCYKRCCSDNNCYDCSYTPLSEYEYSTAECLEPSEYGSCMSWVQEEYDEHNFHFREYETYKCIEQSMNGRYCLRWVGDIDSEEEFEITTCQCLIPDEESVTYCSYWTCYETGLTYFYPNLVWVLLPIMVCAPLLILLGFYAYKRRRLDRTPGSYDFSNEQENHVCQDCCMVSCFLLIFASMTIAAAFLGGFLNVIIAIGACIMLSIVGIYFCFKLKKPESPEKPESPAYVTSW